MIGSINGMGSQMGMQMMQTMSMQRDPSEMYNKIDKNSDGGIDQSELQAFADNFAEKTGNTIEVEDAMTTYDADSDGVLNQDEMKSLMKDNGPPPPSGMPMGENEDSASISTLLDLFENQSEENFDRIDSNRDGEIDQSELQAFADNFAEKTGNTIEAEDAMTTYDADEDGVLNQDEMESLMKDNGPPPAPPFQMQQAISSYGSSTQSEQIGQLLELLNNNDTSYSPLNLFG